MEVRRPESLCCHAGTKANAVLLRETVNYSENVHQSTDCITSMRCSETVGELQGGSHRHHPHLSPWATGAGVARVQHTAPRASRCTDKQNPPSNFKHKTPDSLLSNSKNPRFIWIPSTRQTAHALKWTSWSDGPKHVISSVVGQFYIIYTTLRCRTEVKGLTRPQILSTLHHIHLVTCKLELATPVTVAVEFASSKQRPTNNRLFVCSFLFSFVSEKQRLIMAMGE